MIELGNSVHSPYRVFHYRVRSPKKIDLKYGDKELFLLEDDTDRRVIYDRFTKTFSCYYRCIKTPRVSFELLGNLLASQGNELVSVINLNRRSIYRLDDSLNFRGVNSLIKLRELLERAELSKIPLQQARTNLVTIFDPDGHWIYLNSEGREILFTNSSVADPFMKLPIYQTRPQLISQKKIGKQKWQYYNCDITTLAIYVLGWIKKDRCRALQLYCNPQLLNKLVAVKGRSINSTNHRYIANR